MKMLNKCKVAFTGTHPDSLYRVAQFGGVLGGDGSKGVWSRRGMRVRNSCRLIRWPLALGALCIALALLVYFLMPKASPPLMVPDNLNSTEWLQSEEQLAKQANSNNLEVKVLPNDSNKRDEHLQDATVILPTVESTSMKPPESTSAQNDGYIDENIGGEDGLETFIELAPDSGSATPKDVNQAFASPSPPIFPTNISPSVQYGNEHQDADSNEKRTPKIAASEHPVTDIYDNKFLTQTFAIFFNKDAAKDPSTSDDESSTISDESVDVVIKPNDSKGAPSFTSGHQNSFGISIEEASKPQSTTQSAVYNTKVSPTLPSMVGKNKVRSTTVRSRWNSTEDGDGICHSTRLSMCRGVLPYDLTTQPLVSGIDSASQLDAAVPYFDYIVRSGCSPRARQFICSLLEPECKPRGMTVTPPCRRACKAVAESCQDVISATLQLSQVFNCAQYPDGGDCLQRGGGECLAGELRCPTDGSCVPLHWRCDNIPDCPGGTDEVDCDGSGCAPSEFKCGGRGSCIPEEWVCDGHRDCPQAEDEADCGAADVVSAASRYPVPVRLPRPSPRPLLNTVTGPSIFTATSRSNPEYESGEELLMMSDSFAPIVEPVPGKKATSSSTRKPKTDPTLYTLGALRKLTLKNAAKAAQEQKTEAPQVTEITPMIIKMDANFKCTAGEKNCPEKADGGKSQDDLEDDYFSDEYTSHSSPCPKGELRCVDGRCITLSQLCDKQTDCSDGADEANCFL